MSKTLVRVAVVLAIAAGIAGLLAYLEYRGNHPRTTDAYTNAHVVRIAAQVSGRVARVAVDDYEHVVAGQLLFELDDTDYRLAVQQAEAELAQAGEDLAAATASASAARAQVEARAADLNKAALALRRTRDLSKDRAIARSQLDDAQDAFDVAKAALEAARGDLTAAEARRGALGARNPATRIAELNLARAELDLERARVTAPGPGTVTEVSLRPGNFVEAGAPLFVLLEDRDWWVDANFRETDLEYLRPGQPATIKIDMYPGLSFHGTVEGMSPASGDSFSLLPAQNATGNWVKVTRRFPVRIHLDAPPEGVSLRIGASSTVVVDTTTE